MGGELSETLGPTFAPLLAGVAKSAAVWFMVANMFMGTMQPLAGAARTLSQLSEDGLLPRSWAKRSRRDVPWVTTLITAGFAIGALLLGVPTWMIAAANFAYLIAIALPSIAVWLLRRNEPDRERPWRAPRGTIMARRRRGGRVVPGDRPRLRAVRAADGAHVARDGLRRIAAVRVASRDRPPPLGPAGGQALAAPQAHRRDDRRDRARRRRLPARRQLRARHRSRADLAAAGHLRRRRDADGRRRPDPARHDRPRRRAGRRRRRSPGHGHGGRPHAGDARPQRRRPGRGDGAHRRPAGGRLVARRGRRDGRLVQHAAARDRRARPRRWTARARDSRAAEGKLERSLRQQAAVARLGQLATRGRGPARPRRGGGHRQRERRSAATSPRRSCRPSTAAGSRSAPRRC